MKKIKTDCELFPLEVCCCNLVVENQSIVQNQIKPSRLSIQLIGCFLEALQLVASTSSTEEEVCMEKNNRHDLF